MTYFDHVRCSACKAMIDPESVASKPGQGLSCPRCGAPLSMGDLFGLKDAFSEEDQEELSLDDVLSKMRAPTASVAPPDGARPASTGRGPTPAAPRSAAPAKPAPRGAPSAPAAPRQLSGPAAPPKAATGAPAKGPAPKPVPAKPTAGKPPPAAPRPLPAKPAGGTAPSDPPPSDGGALEAMMALRKKK